ncbi:MAG: hypothetical protein HQM10_20310 [Candidatus Riflebacteria bacterium]|nr:hypothetical protein [Candidatus Riflebacteria bacterium]
MLLKNKYIIIGIILSFCLIQKEVTAWGPMTHMSVNEAAYTSIAAELNKDFIIQPEYSYLFIGCGPAPDIKQTAGSEFPDEYHKDIETVLRMVDKAKSDKSFGLEDVIMALGWAGHLYAEVTSAHTQDGYPNSKVSCTTVNYRSLNHQINEVAIDFLTYHQNKEKYSGAKLVFPLRLLESSMSEDNANGKIPSIMKAETLKNAANAFLPNVVGIRAICEYLESSRPEIFDEMDAFYSDRHDAINTSIGEVKRLLREHAKNNFSKPIIKSADGTDRVGISLNGTLSAKVKQTALAVLGRTLKSERGNDAFTTISYYFVTAGLSSSIWRDKFLKAAFSSTPTTGDESKNKQVLNRFLEALLTRYDLTYPEILAYAQQEIKTDPTALALRSAQFKEQGLTADGRKPVSVEEAMAAVREVERIEAVRREWPWFWPWRPGENTLATAREKASRLLAYSILDQTSGSTFLKAEAGKLLEMSQALRKKIKEYDDLSIFNVFSKLKIRSEMSAISEACGYQQRQIAEILRVKLAISASPNPAERIAAMVQQATNRIAETDKAIETTKQFIKDTPAWNLIQRNKLNDELKQLQKARESTVEYLTTLTAVQKDIKSQSSRSESALLPSDKNTVAQTSQSPDSESYSQEASRAFSAEYSKAQAEFENAYKLYTTLAQKKSADDPEMKAALQKMRNANIRREKALKSSQSSNR